MILGVDVRAHTHTHTHTHIHECATIYGDILTQPQNVCILFKNRV